MKRFLFIGMMVLLAACGSVQNSAKVNNLKEQQKVLDLTSKLNKLQLDYEKAKADYNDASEKAASVNAEANPVTTDFNPSDATSTVKDAKSTIKRLKEAKQTGEENCQIAVAHRRIEQENSVRRTIELATNAVLQVHLS